MNPVDAGQCAEYLLVAHRNDSLSRSDRHRVFCFIFGVSILIALAFTAMGAWPVLPFAGLEMAVLYAAFRYVDRHASDYECLEIDGDRVRIEIREGSDVQRVELNRHWAQVVMHEKAGRRWLALRSHGREVEFGRHLTNDERERVGRELAQQLGKAL
ncbi:MAG TPA: DUF2244 domain-containing protein [Burkholderiales bacterium]|nr:DUF2244 domain-containing protein [Burkholderiales bacterium]